LFSAPQSVAAADQLSRERPQRHKTLSECPSRFKSAASRATASTLFFGGYHGVIGLTDSSTLRPIVVDFAARFLSLSKDMRLLIEILIIVAVIFFGWNTPFKEDAAWAKARITSALDSLGGSLQKHQDKSVRRY
jgi:hypothetical protein